MSVSLDYRLAEWTKIDWELRHAIPDMPDYFVEVCKNLWNSQCPYSYEIKVLQGTLYIWFYNTTLRCSISLGYSPSASMGFGKIPTTYTEVYFASFDEYAEKVMRPYLYKLLETLLISQETFGPESKVL